MMANELIKELSEFMTEDGYTELDKTIFKSVNMLRQQSVKIEELEKALAEEQIYSGILEAVNKSTPQIKELSDEEIEQIAVKWYVGTRILPIGFARAILKKASEK
jgi:hypothetical protein